MRLSSRVNRHAFPHPRRIEAYQHDEYLPEVQHERVFGDALRT
jgi:hypothetical protein